MYISFAGPTNFVYVHTNVGFHLENPLSLMLQITRQDFRGGKGLLLKYNLTVTTLTFGTYWRPTRCASVAIHLSYEIIKNVYCWFARVGLKQTINYNPMSITFRLNKRPTPTLINASLTFDGGL
jgi:hypothetical protein